MNQVRFREHSWMRSVRDAERLTREPAPPPTLAFIGVAVATGVSGALVVTLVSIYGAHTATSQFAFGAASSSLIIATGFLVSGYNQRRQRVFLMYSAGLSLITVLRALNEPQAHKSLERIIETQDTLHSLQHKLAEAGAYREAMKLRDACTETRHA
ncbi:hypothetical protein ACMATS_20860 [Streptoverticillium reticulum]|uniref:hypothetical protein n=1 Tax=Streptoverticillium reticulum TaxID=1433415 RepID=UPI0039BF43B2